MTDVYAFPGSAADRIALVLNSWALLTPAQDAERHDLRSNLLYQFKIDNTGDAKEDQVIQVTFKGTGADQTVEVRGPIAPPVVGAMRNTVANVDARRQRQRSTGARHRERHAGVRRRARRSVLHRSRAVLPHPPRSQAGHGPALAAPRHRRRAASFRAPGTAVDFARRAFNVLSIVIELPASQLTAGGQREDRPLGHDQPLMHATYASQLEDISQCDTTSSSRRARRIVGPALAPARSAFGACSDNNVSTGPSVDRRARTIRCSGSAIRS